jgi:HEAT repeat protein
LRHGLNDPDAEVRRTAVRGLWEDETPALLEALLRMLTSDPDVTVRSAAATGLGSFVFAAECEELDAKRALAIRQALEQTIADPQLDLEVRRHAVEAISFINDEAVRRIIDQAYAHDDERMRVSAIFAMGRSADPFWADTVLAELADGAPKMRFEAARACGELQLRRAIGTLAKLAHAPDRDLASASIWSLGQIGGKRARAVLVTLAESEDEEVVEWAVQALDEAEFAIRAMDLLAVDPENRDFEEEELAAEDEEDDFLDEEEDDDELDLDGEAEWSDEFLDLDEDE